MLSFEIDLIETRCTGPQSPKSNNLTFEVDLV